MKQLLLVIAVLAMAGIANAQQCIIDADCPNGTQCRQNPAGDGGYCVNTETDNHNCGQLYLICNVGAGETCVNGQCECQFGTGCGVIVEPDMMPIPPGSRPPSLQIRQLEKRLSRPMQRLI